MEIIGTIIIIITIINTIALIIKHDSDAGSVFAIMGLFAFSMVGIIATYFTK